MADALERKREIRKIGEEEVEVIFKKSLPPTKVPEFYPPLDPRTYIEDDIIVERDVPITLRDGVTIYTDIFRPEGDKKVPALLSWSCPGKNFSFNAKGGIPGIIDKDTLSPWCKQEGPDPAYWCHYGYAVINPDSRGVANSEGDFNFFSDVEIEDCCETIEWIAQQPWCNGRVGMSGTAFEGISAWFAAAKKPPHLVCIAPDATYDVHSTIVMNGGIFDAEMMTHVMSRFFGNGYQEDIVSMVAEHPLMDAYWEEKIAKVENIEIPVLSHSNTNVFHSGCMDAHRKVNTDKKWLWTDNGIAWRDNYFNSTLELQRQFFDRYLKNIRNGWEFTPKVRLAVYDAPGKDILGQVESEWPPARAEHKKLYLNAANGTLSFDEASEAATVSYTAGVKGEAVFNITFNRDIEMLGYGKLHAWVEVQNADDMNLFVSLAKIGADGKPVPMPGAGQIHGGTSGRLKVSMRELDVEKTTESEPVLTYRSVKKLSPGEIVPVDIPLLPFGFKWHAGESLRLTLSDEAKRIMSVPMPEMDWGLEKRGVHIIHTGGEFDSYLLIPEVPC